MIVCKILLICIFVKIIGYIILSTIKGKTVGQVTANCKSPSVEIIVPMFNEEKVIIHTIQTLLNINHPVYAITIIDDGSTDNSLSLALAHFESHPKVKILTQTNKGKSSALNYAINRSTSDLVICLDADTLVMPNIIKNVLPYFSNAKVGAISGYIKVGNKNNLITKMQYQEYITNQNFERGVFEGVNGIFTIPGAIGAFRRSVLVEVGGYSVKTLTEDSDITVKILNNNYIIKNAPDVIGFTEAPSTTKMFFRQRVRWKIGSIQVLLRYRKTLFSHPNKALIFLVMPFLWLFDIILPIVTHFVDYLLIYYLVIRQPLPFFIYYSAYILTDSLVCFIILHKKRERTSIIHICMQRLFLRHLMFFVYIHIIFSFMKGNLFQWNKVNRDGNVVVA